MLANCDNQNTHFVKCFPPPEIKVKTNILKCVFEPTL